MPNPYEPEKTHGLHQLVAQFALPVRRIEHTCPPLLDQGPNPLWSEVQSLTQERDELRRQIEALKAALREQDAEAESLESQLATERELKATYLAEANAIRSRLVALDPAAQAG